MPDPTSPWRHGPGRRIAIGFALLGSVLVYGTAGYIVMGWSFMDSFYQVFITISAVGLTEVHPLVSTPLRLHTMLIIAMGLFSVAYTLGGFISLLTEGEFQKYLGQQRMMKQIETQQGHTIVAGFGRVGAMVCEGLTGSAFRSWSSRWTQPGWRRLRPESSCAWWATRPTRRSWNKPASNARAGWSAPGQRRRQCLHHAHGPRTLTRSPDHCPGRAAHQQQEAPSGRGKPRDHAGRHWPNRIVSLLTNPTALEFVELVTQRSSLAIEMNDIPIQAESPLAGQTLRDADIGRLTGVMVMAIKRGDGRVEFPPSGDSPLEPGDSIVLLGRRTSLDNFREKFVV